MYTTDVTVTVTTDVEIEPVAELNCHVPEGRYYLSNFTGKIQRACCDQKFERLHLIVTPKEPAVSEPEVFTIPVEVPKEVWEKYESGYIGTPMGGTPFMDDCGDVRTPHVGWSMCHKRLCFTPRTPSYEYPAELMSPEIHSIAADEGWKWWIYSRLPGMSSFGNKRWDAKCGTCTRWNDIAWMFPNVQMPTPEQCHNDWRQSCFQNPQWKGNP